MCTFSSWSKVDAEREILFHSGSVVVTLQSRNRREHPVKRNDADGTMTTPISDFYLTLTSNASTSVYPNDGPSGFKVTLPNVYVLHGDEWQMGLASLIYPRTWVNMPFPTDEELKDFRHKGVFYARIFSRRRPARYNVQTKYPDERWVPLHVAQGLYEVEDMMKGIRQALRDEFGQSLADQEFKFDFDEDAKQVTITAAAWSCLFLNLWMHDILESDTFGGFTITWRHFAEWKKYYEQFVLLGSDEYLVGTTKNDQKLSFQHLRHSCPNRQGDLLARIAPGLSVHVHLFGCGGVSSGVGRPGQFVARHRTQRKSWRDDHLEFCPSLLQRCAGQVVLRGDTGRPIPFLGGVVEVTLHFRKK